MSVGFWAQESHFVYCPNQVGSASTLLCTNVGCTSKEPMFVLG